MTESGATGSAGDTGLPRAGGDPSSPPPPDGQPPVASPPELPDESVLTPSPERDDGTIVPDQLHDAPAYIPPAMGMSSGSVMPPLDPADVPGSAWITTAPQAATARRGVTPTGIVAAVVVVIIVGGLVALLFGLLPSNKGKVLFGTAAGTALCSVSNETTTVKSTDPVFFTAVLKHRMDGDQTITLHVTKDGEEFVSLTESPAGTPFDCYTSHESMGNLEAGSYMFEIIHNKDIEATGNLTVQ